MMRCTLIPSDGATRRRFLLPRRRVLVRDCPAAAFLLPAAAGFPSSSLTPEVKGVHRRAALGFGTGALLTLLVSGVAAEPAETRLRVFFRDHDLALVTLSAVIAPRRGAVMRQQLATLTHQTAAVAACGGAPC